MRHVRGTLLALLFAGCHRGAPVPKVALTMSGQAIRPDSTQVDGVVTFTHPAGTFTRAAQLTLDTVPLVIFDGGTNGDFDLTRIWRPLLLANGQLLASMSMGQGRLVLFNADGTPAHVVAPYGEGPGDVRSPVAPVAVTSDTAIVIDGNTHRLNWVTADRGIMRTQPLRGTLNPFCFQNVALLANRHLLASNGCLREDVIDRPSRPVVDVVAMGLDFGAPDTVARLPGFEMIPFETRYGGHRREAALVLRFGESAQVAPWDSGFVTATGVGGYLLERRAIGGHVVARIRVAEPRRAVTAAMRAEQIRRELERLSGQQAEDMADPDEARREAHEVPFADSLPPYGALLTAPDDILWVTDYAAPTDSSWSATAFRPDGAIVGRLTAYLKGATPVAFGTDRVLVRLVDDDGVVRFGVYRLAPVNHQLR